MHACPLVDEAIAYSLHQLTADEELAFHAHLSTCAACRLKLAEIAETVDLLPLAVPPASPAPDLKARVLNRVAQEASTARQARRRRWALPASAAAAAALALVIGTYSLMRIEGLHQQFIGFARTAPVERTVTMAGTDKAPAAAGRVLVARDAGGTRITLQAQGLPPLESGEAYQLWLVKDGKRTSGGVFVVDATGKGGVATWLPDAVEFDTLGITREPDSLGLQPRGPKVMGSITG